MFFNNSKKIRNEVNRYFNNKYPTIKNYWQFDPLYSNKVQLNWVEQYKTKLDSILLYPRIHKSEEDDTTFMFRKSKDFMYDSLINLFIYFNNKMILSLNFDDSIIQEIEKIKIYNDVFMNLKTNNSVKIPMIETIEKTKTDKIISLFKVLHGGDLLEHSVKTEKI